MDTLSIEHRALTLTVRSPQCGHTVWGMIDAPVKKHTLTNKLTQKHVNMYGHTCVTMHNTCVRMQCIPDQRATMKMQMQSY